MITYSLMRIAMFSGITDLSVQLWWQSHLACLLSCKPALNFNNFTFNLSPPESLSAVVQTCNIAQLQLHNSATSNPLPVAGPWQNAVSLIQLIYKGFILCLTWNAVCFLCAISPSRAHQSPFPTTNSCYSEKWGPVSCVISFSWQLYPLALYKYQKLWMCPPFTPLSSTQWKD